MARLYLAAPEPTEDELHASVASTLDRLLVPPAMWTTFPAGAGLLAPQAAARLSRIGLKPGWPDLLVVFAGVLHGIELKVGTNTLSRTRVVHTRQGRPRIVIGQHETHAMLRAAGAKIAVCRSVASVLAQLRIWRIPTREATQ